VENETLVVGDHYFDPVVIHAHTVLQIIDYLAFELSSIINAQDSRLTPVNLSDFFTLHATFRNPKIFYFSRRDKYTGFWS